MDRKTVTAFILIMMVFLLSFPYMKWVNSRKQAPVDSSRVAATDQGTREAEEVKRTPRPEAILEEPEEALVELDAPEEAPSEAKEIEVSTPLYRAKFTSRGGNLVEWKLTQYLLKDDGMVSLIREGEPKFLNLKLQLRQGPMELDRYEFSVDKSWLEISGDEQGKLVFQLPIGDGAKIIKEYTFFAGRYDYRLRLKFIGTGRMFPEVKDYWLELSPGLNTTEANEKNDRKEFKAISYMGGRPVQHNLGDVKNGKQVTDTGDITWAGLRTKYFLTALAPREARLEETQTWGDEESLSLALRMRGRSLEDEYLVYMGPLEFDTLKGYQADLEQAVNLGWRWIRPISRLILWLLKFLHGFIPNYGLVIIIFSIIVKILFHPLSLKSLESMKRMQQLQPQIKELQQKHKKNPQQLNKAMMGLYKTNKVNPMGSCLPLLLQMPVFIALYAVLYHNIEMRGAGFAFWITDLSQKDPFYVMPILMGITMFVQQKMTAATDPRQAMMTYIMPIIFTWFFLGFPSGLVLYWLVNNLLQIGQQRLMKPKPIVTAPTAAADGVKKKG